MNIVPLPIKENVEDLMRLMLVKGLRYIIEKVTLPEQHPLLKFGIEYPPSHFRTHQVIFVNLYLNHFTMKTSKIVPVLALRVYESPREEVTVNGTKVVRCGALTLQTEVDGTKALKLSAKQLDNLAGLAGINYSGKAGWLAFKSLIGLCRSRAMITVEEYKTGDEYSMKGADGKPVIGKHTVDGRNITVDAIMLADGVVKDMDAKTIDIVNSWNKFVIPEVETVKEFDQDGVN